MFSDSADGSLNLAGVKRQHDPANPRHPQLRLRGAPSCALSDGAVVELEVKDALLLAPRLVTTRARLDALRQAGNPMMYGADGRTQSFGAPFARA